MNIEQAVREIAQQLAQIRDDVGAMHDAWLLLETVTGKTRTALFMENNHLTMQQQTLLAAWINQMVVHHKPLQYIVGTVSFLDLELYVQPPILIPRSETESWCVSFINAYHAVRQKPLRFLDIGVGSGCIALSLARAFPHATVYGVDIDPNALALAKKNGEHNSIDNVVWCQSDLFSSLTGMTFDGIVANPPYISAAEWKKLDMSVKLWESRQALCAEQEGLALLVQIIDQAPEFLQSSFLAPQLWLEIGHAQGNAVRALLHKRGFREVQVLRDVQGYDRVVVGLWDR